MNELRNNNSEKFGSEEYSMRSQKLNIERNPENK